ncbi:MAG: hypothetical protein JNJ61_25500 [Anaerolineae bacterium]|nr:hypothetical protein [Anaerolineae bacterium]
MAEQNIVSKIIEPLTGIKVPHYVAGRLLTPDDLKADQAATLRRDAILGQAVGYGIIDGFWVTAEYPNGGTEKVLLKISSGTAITYAGELLQLHSDEGHSFPVREDVPNSPIFQPFKEVGAYLLTVGLAQESIGSVPTFGIESTTKKRRISRWDDNNGCTEQWLIDGLQFKLFYLGRSFQNSVSSKTRSHLAHWCFGGGSNAGHPFDPVQGLPGIETNAQLLGLDPKRDLPLAVFHWTNNTIEFVDNWSVRRRLVRPDIPHTAHFNGSILSDSIAAMSEARLLQFQNQLGDVLEDVADGETFNAYSYFDYLPPAGYLPVELNDNLVSLILFDLIKLTLETILKYVSKAVGGDNNIPYVNHFTELSEEQHNLRVDETNMALDRLIERLDAFAESLKLLDTLSSTLETLQVQIYDAFINSQQGHALKEHIQPLSAPSLLDTFFSTGESVQPSLRLSYATPGQMRALVGEANLADPIQLIDLEAYAVDLYIPDVYRVHLWALLLSYIDQSNHDLFDPLLTNEEFNDAWYGENRARSEMFQMLGADPHAIFEGFQKFSSTLPSFYILFVRRGSPERVFHFQRYFSPPGQ